MLRNEESMDRQFHRSVEIGKDNQICISGMRSWCKNVEIEQESWGIYAEMTGLPIGFHNIGCPYVDSKIGGAHLRGITSNFLNQHCAGCPHHIPNGDVTWGQEIIDEHIAQKAQAQRLSDETNHRIQKLRVELRGQSVAIADQESVEARSVLAYLEAMFSESEAERDEASNSIRQAASIGAELFPIKAARLIATLARTPEYSEAMLSVCAIFGPKLTDLAEDLVETALTNIETGLHVESSAAVLRSVGNAAAFPLNELHIRQLLLSQDHNRLSVVFNGADSNYPNSTAVLVKSFDADSDSVTSVVREELESEIDHNRTTVCGAFGLVQKERPSIGLDLLDSLITSLSLYDLDDTYDGPSTRIVPILRATLMYDPAATDKAIGAAFSNARPAVQEDFTNVYAQLGKSHHDANQKFHPQLSAIVTNRLWEWIRDERLTIEVRLEALRSLETAYDLFPSRAANGLETLLGYLAIVSAQEPPSTRPTSVEIPGEPSSEFVEQLEQQSGLMRWNAFKWELTRCLTTLSRHDAAMVFQAIADCLDQPLDQINKNFKASCVSVLGNVAANYEIRSRALPYVWKALMDYGSSGTRSQAIEATVNMFGNDISPPPNLVEIILISLTDRYVVVHQAALRAVVRRPHWFSTSQTSNLLGSLATLLNTYATEQFRVKEIWHAMVGVARVDPRFKIAALRFVEKVFPTGEKSVDQEIVSRMIGFYEPTEAIAGVIAKCVAVYLGEYRRDSINNFGDSEREQMLAWLRQLPIVTFRQASDDLLTNALKAAERDDVWGACNLAGIFAHFAHFQQECDVLGATLLAIPNEPRRARQRALVQSLTEAAAQNASLQANEAGG